MATLRKPDKLFWLAGERKQSLAKADGDGGIAYAMHDQEGSGDARNALRNWSLISQRTGIIRSSEPAMSTIEV